MNLRQGAWLAAALSAAALTAAVRPGVAQEAARPAAPTAKPQTAQIGQPFKDFKLRDLATGKKADTVSLASYQGKKPVVLIFMANRCGTTWTYEEKMGKLLKDYGKDVAVMAVHTNYQETDGEIMGQIEQRNLAIPVLDDKPTQALGRYVGATATPTFVVLDKSGVLRYKGSFDKYGDDSVAYVRPALDAVLNGKEVAVKSTRAFG